MLTNSNIVIAAERYSRIPRDLTNTSMRVSTNLNSYGYLPGRARDILQQGYRRGDIDRIIYSYETPIAWRDRGTWVYPRVTYSVTTSGKHQIHLWQLRPVSVPGDCGLEEYESYLSGRSVYEHGTIRAGRE